MKKKWRILFFAIGIVSIAFLVIRSKPSKKEWAEILQPKTLLFLLGMMLLWALIYFVHEEALRQVIGPESAAIRRISLYRIIVSGFALNNLTPVGLAGGEPYRIMELKPYLGLKKATSSTLNYSILFIIGHVLLWLTGILIYVLMGCPGETFLTVLLMIAAAVLLAAALLFFLKRKGGLLMPALRFFGKIPFLRKPVGKMLDKNGAHIEEIDQYYGEFKRARRSFASSCVLEYLARILECAEYFLIFLFLGQKINIFGGILILSMASLVGNLFFMIPMQAGTREGGMVLALGWLGIDPSAGVMGGLLYRVRDILGSLIGVLCILIEKKHEEKLEKRGI